MSESLKPGQFIFNSLSSATDLSDSRIQLRPEIPVPVRKSEFISVPGVSGDYILDENAYNNTTMTLELICEVSGTDTAVTEMREKIAHSFDSGGYVPLELYFDSQRIYYVKVTGGPTFRLSGQWPNILLYSVELSVKPFKYYSVDYKYILPTTGGLQTVTFTNPSNYISKPKITLNGVGDLDITINASTYSFKGVDDYIIIDSEVGEAYKLSPEGQALGRNNKMYTRSFPYLSSGSNTVSYSGATEITIEGRWATLVG